MLHLLPYFIICILFSFPLFQQSSLFMFLAPKSCDIMAVIFSFPHFSNLKYNSFSTPLIFAPKLCSYASFSKDKRNVLLNIRALQFEVFLLCCFLQFLIDFSCFYAKLNSFLQVWKDKISHSISCFLLIIHLLMLCLFLMIIVKRFEDYACYVSLILSSRNIPSAAFNLWFVSVYKCYRNSLLYVLIRFFFILGTASRKHL